MITVESKHYCRENVEWVQQQLKRHLAEQPGVGSYLEAIANRPGKLLRARLFFSAARPDRLTAAALRIPVGLELLHLASLLHDDLMDRTAFRRGVPSLWRNSGCVAALLCGDYLFAQAFKEIALAGLPAGVPLMGTLVAGMARAELEQDAHLFDPGVTVLQYLRRIRLKTARFFGVAAVLGGLVSGTSPFLLRRLYRFGVDLGLAFQMADDLRDMFTLDGGDLAKGILSLPILLLIREKRQGLVLVTRICRLRRLRADELYGLKCLLAESESLRRVEREIRAYLHRARQLAQAMGEERLFRFYEELHQNLTASMQQGASI
ncbi:MAG TPA: hypothetical protein GX391_09770 [Firmicutes bacterium]|nr:hypothetical protein [Bacillota bacterium]